MAMNGAMAFVAALCIHAGGFAADDSLASGLLCKRLP